MLVHKYLEEVLGNKAIIAILRTMLKYKGMVFTIRKLAGVADLTHNEAALAIHDLEKLGIIKIQPIGKAYHLELNNKSYILNEIVKPAIQAEKNTITELVNYLRKIFDTKKIVTAAIFGSVATTQEKIDSDIDLFIVCDDSDYAMTLIVEASREVASRFHGDLSPIIFTQKELKAKKRGHLVQSIINDHILISGKKISSDQ